MPRKRRELRVQRPEPEVLPDSALVHEDDESKTSRVASPTHEVSRDTPFFRDARHWDVADGYLARGTRVTLLSRAAGRDCRVRDEDGREVYVSCMALRERS